MWTNKKTEKKLLEIAQKQGGYFTSGQALNAGYSYRLQSYHKEQKHWKEIDTGLYKLTNLPVSEYDDLIRWSLWSRDKKGNPQAVISHESALVVHELGDIMPAEVEVRDDFSVTTPIKTIIDVAEGNISLEQLEQIVRDGLDKGLVRPVQFQKVHMSTKVRSKISTVLANLKKNP